MKRLFLLVVAALSAVVLAAGTQAANDAKGPPCTNVTGGGDSLAYVAPAGGSGIVEADFILAAPACAKGSYELTIYSLDGKTLIAKNVQPASATGNTVHFHYEIPSGAAPSDGVCLVGTTDWNGRIVDRVPDTGCAPVGNGDAGGYGGWN